MLLLFLWLLRLVTDTSLPNLFYFLCQKKKLNYLFISLTFTEERGYSLQGTFEEVKRYFDKDKTSNQTNTSETMYNVLGFINFVFGFFFFTDILDKFLHLCMRVY